MQIYHQSAFDKWNVDSNSVQSIVTSPPYYSLRRYNIPDVIIGVNADCSHEFISQDNRPSGGTAGNNALVGATQNNEANMRGRIYTHEICQRCGAFKGQYGLEPDYRDYVTHTVLWAKEAWRVLKSDGVFFLNIADTYKGSGGASRHYGYSDSKYPEGRSGEFVEPAAYPQGKIKAKSQMLIPHRVALALIDDGWILRNTIIWYKPNALPESVRDRFSKKYEYIFMFSKQERYKFNLDAVREPHKTVSIERERRAVSNNHKWLEGADGQAAHTMSKPRPNRNTKISKEDAELFGSPRARVHRHNGANTGVNNKEPYKHNNSHLMRLKTEDREEGSYAVSQSNVFLDPADSMVCVLNKNGKNPGDVWCPPDDDISSDLWVVSTQPSPERHFAMWPEALVERMILCSSDVGDIVLDPFAGSGTTLLAAERLNRAGVGIDLGYKEIQHRRLSRIQKTLAF